MTNSKLINETVIARINYAGVFMGVLDYVDDDIVRLTDVRRIYRWRGALSVTDMAKNGLIGGEITEPCAMVEFNRQNLIEINKCSEDAVNSIKQIKPWKL